MKKVLIILFFITASSAFAQRTIFAPRQIDYLDSLIAASSVDSTDLDSLYTKTSHIVNAAEFGVISDGATDISTELQAAFDYANSISQEYPALYFSSYAFVKSQGATVTLPAGTFIIKSTIDWSGMPKIHFVGQGIGQTIVFVEIDSVTDGFISTDAPSYPKSITIENMSIIGGQTTTDSIAVRDLINITSNAFINMKNVYLYRADRYCLHFGGDILNSFIEEVTCNLGLKAGLKIDGTTPTSTTFLRCYFREAKEGSGIDIINGLNIVFDQCIFEGNGETYPDSSYGARIRSGIVRLISPYFEANKGVEVRFGEVSTTRNDLNILYPTFIGVKDYPAIWVDTCYSFNYIDGIRSTIRDTVFKFTQNSTGIFLIAPKLLESKIYYNNTSTSSTSQGVDSLNFSYYCIANSNGVGLKTGGYSVDYNGYNANISNAIVSPTIDSLKTTLEGLGAGSGISFTNANIWGAGRNFTSRLENVLYSATNRTTVSDTGFESITQGDLFDNNYDTWASVDSSDTGIVYIDFTTKGEFEATNGIIYPNGYVLLNIYYRDLPDTVIGQVLYKDSTNWTDMTDLEDISINALYNVYKLTVPTASPPYAKKFRFYIIAKSTKDAGLTEIEYYPLRPYSLGRPLVNKFVPNSLYQKTSWKNYNNKTTASIDTSGVFSGRHILPITFLNPTTDDTLFFGKWDRVRYYDSLAIFDIEDSIAIQLFYRTDGDYNLITVVDTLTADATISFDVTTIPINAKVYLCFVYLGSTEAYLRSQLYWRDE